MRTTEGSNSSSPPTVMVGLRSTSPSGTVTSASTGSTRRSSVPSNSSVTFAVPLLPPGDLSYVVTMWGSPSRRTTAPW